MNMKGLMKVYYMPNMYSYPNYPTMPTFAQGTPKNGNWAPNEWMRDWNWPNYMNGSEVLKDYGANPFVINIKAASKHNNTYRTALWTGEHLQVTLMSLYIGEDIGLEVHPHVDQFIQIEQGQGIVQMGPSKENLPMQWQVYEDSAIFIPAGTWHNVLNTGNVPMKLFSIYAPPNHPFGTVHKTKADAMTQKKRS